ncbi:hypothetical protein EDB92DRAFT_1863619 [Lactarius akahatsu]|uniref:C2H2-type domain-containing protein n=1 Tax=Lactarius akahatsu TaxID=416441 RepID=A0AAD4LGH7_9AGAM|nr:hypothetical protein EDB92DRAFT_1863619 [Lactarius akahatsu]
MSYSQTATSDPYAFSLWPDASAASEEMTMLAQAAGCTQPGLTVEDIFFDDLLDTTLAQGSNSTTPAETFGSHKDTNWTTGGTVAADMPPHPNATAMSTTTTFAPTTFPLADNMGAYTPEFFFPQSDWSLSVTPSLTDVSSLPSPRSDGTRNGIIPFPTLGATSSYIPQPPLAGLSFPQIDIAGAWGPNQIISAPPDLFMGGSNFVAQVQSDSGQILDPSNMYMNTTSSSPWDCTQFLDHLTMPTEALVTMVGRETAPPSSIGKRNRESDESGSGSPKKRGKPSTTRLLGGAGSTKRTRRSPATRTRQLTNHKSKAAGRGAEMLVSTTVQGLYHQSLPGLSVPQGSMGALFQEQPSWIEEREQVEPRHDSGSSVPFRGVENAEDGEVLRKIPTNLTERERLMLQTTQADEERGAVRYIMCRVCSDRCFPKWATFQRHCKSCEKHPSELKFCPKCGDYFGRQDSETRHKDKRHQGACLSTSQDEAREKEQKATRILEAFEARLQRCLRSGEDPGPRFSEVMSRKLMNTSKKVSKAETSLEGESWATGLC